MQRLQSIMQYLIETFQCIVLDEYETKREINRVDVLHADTILDSHTLYLCPDPVSFLAAHKNVFFQVPLHQYCLLTEEKRPLPFSVVKLNHAPSVNELFIAVNRFFVTEEILTAQTARLYECLNQGCTLTDILKQSSEYFHGSVSVCDASYHFVATTPGYGEPVDYLPKEEIASMKRFHIVDKIYRSEKAFESVTPDYPDTHWVFCAIRFSNVMIGFLAICLGNTNATPQQLSLAYVLSEVCSIELQRHDTKLSRTGQSYEDFLVHLLNGKFNDAEFIRQQVLLLDHHLGNYFCILCFSGSGEYDRHIFNQRQMAALRQYYTNSMSVVYQDCILLFLTQDTPMMQDEAFFHRFLEFASLNHLHVGISQPFSDLLMTNAYFNQAFKALKMGQSKHPHHVVHAASEWMGHLLLNNCNLTELKSSIHYHLSYLGQYDTANHTDLLDSLRSYLLHDRNAAKTADALSIHRSTLFYRIKKIEELLGITLTDSHLLFLYELSFLTMDYLELN